MNEQLQKIMQLAQAGNVTNRNAILELIKLWGTLKSSLLRALRALPTNTMQQQQNVQLAIDNVEVLHIWPWSGMLEDVLKNVGTELILEHWARCINFAKDAMQTANQQTVQPPAGVTWPPR
jgi:hypothetical protein